MQISTARVALFLGLVAAGGKALACSVLFIPISGYLNDKVPDAAIFEGKVIAVTPVKKVESIEYVDVVMQTGRWYRGARQPAVTVRGRTAGGDPCFGQLAFFPKVGEQWLMVGRMQDGKLDPDALTSRPMPEGKLFPETASQLKPEACETNRSAVHPAQQPYSASKDPYVFTGKVTAVREAAAPKGGVPPAWLKVYDIELSANRWLRGEPQPRIVVRSAVDTEMLCPDPPAFLPKVGEQWLLSGSMREGKLIPNPIYSVRILDSRLPQF